MQRVWIVVIKNFTLLNNCHLAGLTIGFKARPPPRWLSNWMLLVGNGENLLDRLIDFWATKNCSRLPFVIVLAYEPHMLVFLDGEASWWCPAIPWLLGFPWFEHRWCWIQLHCPCILLYSYSWGVCAFWCVLNLPLQLVYIILSWTFGMGM